MNEEVRTRSIDQLLSSQHSDTSNENRAIEEILQQATTNLLAVNKQVIR